MLRTVGIGLRLEKTGRDRRGQGMIGKDKKVHDNA